MIFKQITISDRYPMLNKLLRVRIPNFPLWVVCFLSACILLWKLGAGSLQDWDEAIYAQIAKEMFQNGDWLTPHWGYHPWFHKPPFFMWSTALLYRLFGVSEFWSRAASAFSGIGVIALTYLIGELLYNRSVGFLAAIILLTSNQFVDSARFGTTDIMLTLFIFLSIYAYLRLQKGNQNWWYLVGISFGLAFLTKGVAGLIGPITITVSLLADRKLGISVKSKEFWLGLLLAILIVLPWHILMYLNHGKSFVDQYLGYHVLVRSTKALEGHKSSPFFYIAELQKHFFPWVYLFPFALALTLNFKPSLKFQVKSHVILLFSILLLLIYTIVKTKISWYIVPIYPALAILIASLIQQAFKSNFPSLAFTGLAIGSFVIVALTPLNLVSSSYISKIILAAFCLVILIILLALVLTKKINYRLAVVIMFAFFFLSGLREIKGLFYGRELPVAKLAKIAGSNVTINQSNPLIVVKFSSKIYMPTSLFYSNRPILWVRKPEELAEFTKNNQKREALIGKKDINTLSKDYSVQIIAESGDLSYSMLQKKP